MGSGVEEDSSGFNSSAFSSYFLYLKKMLRLLFDNRILNCFVSHLGKFGMACSFHKPHYMTPLCYGRRRDKIEPRLPILGNSSFKTICVKKLQNITQVAQIE